MSKISLQDIMELSVDERIALVEEVWETIAAEPEAVPMTEEQRLELDRRLAQFDRDPNSGRPWDEVRARILTQGKPQR